MTEPVYECPVCETRQPAPSIDTDEPPATLGNTTCRGKFGGCLRMVRLELVPGATWEPTEWELGCPMCDYETLGWGPVGFADATRWDCPDCGNAMQVLSVGQKGEEEKGERGQGARKG